MVSSVSKTLFISLMFVVGLLGLKPDSRAADNFNPGKIAEGAPLELKHWRKLIGQWRISSQRMSEDESGWIEGSPAQWEFLWTYDGWGIQDTFTSPPQSQPLADESVRLRDITMRIFDPVAKVWSVNWLTTGTLTPGEYTTEASRKKIVLNPRSPDETGVYHRVTFENLTETSFEWALELSSDGDRWREVARRQGVRLTD